MAIESGLLMIGNDTIRKEDKTVMRMLPIIGYCLVQILPVLNAQIVEGPFKAEPEVVSPEKDGILLRYKASSRSSAQTVQFTEDTKVSVDIGIVGNGIEAYLSMTYQLVVLDYDTKKTLWAKNIGAWYSTLSFIRADDASTGKAIVLLWVGGEDGTGRCFDIRIGDEKYLQRSGKNLIASPHPKSELRGTPLTILQVLKGDDSKVQKPAWTRVISLHDWSNLWRNHVGSVVAIPSVDFSNNMVIAGFNGASMNSQSLAIEYALDCEDSIEVFVRSECFQSGPEGKRVTPYGIFVIPSSPKRVIVKQNVQGLIGGPPVWKVVADLPPLAESKFPY